VVGCLVKFPRDKLCALDIKSAELVPWKLDIESVTSSTVYW
jgi:hypothetical protein